LVRFLSILPGHWGTSFHYSAPLAPILVMSAGDGLARLLRARGGVPVTAQRMRDDSGLADRRRSSPRTWAIAAMVVLSACLPVRQPMWRLFSPAHWAADVAERTAPAVLAMIPAQASVAA